MAKKWSEKTAKQTLVGEDEMLILDSQDASPATKNKRVKISAIEGGLFGFALIVPTEDTQIAPTVAAKINRIDDGGGSSDNKMFAPLAIEGKSFFCSNQAGYNVNIFPQDGENFVLQNQNEPFEMEFDPAIIFCFISFKTGEWTPARIVQ